ncbi:MAG: DUF616 domain-containing protein [Rickettsiales bacterium TMED289]|nr:MAG: DUF616 domain-containing protein [Rickettsiales bacterium TMED289]|tara:strand:+ start:738 stop:1475 length:738 start_codon:yes stop_codon:yes gene_type:complete
MIIVYTCIAGSYDTLIKQPQFEDVTYVCFSDSIAPGIHKRWEVRSIDNPTTDKPNLLNRFYKIFPFKFFSKNEYSLYIDGNIRLKVHPRNLLDQFKKSQKSMAVFRHPNRKYLKDELEACINQGKLHGEQIYQAESFLSAIKQEGFSSPVELVAGYILLRRHDDNKLNDAMKDWFKIVSNQVPRDQLSLVYALWKNNNDLAYLDDWIEPEKFFDRLHHGFFIPIMPLYIQNFFKKMLTKIKALKN